MRIGICGSHCSGKSTLARALSVKLNITPLINLAHCIDDDRYLLSTQFHILLNQILREHEHDDFVSDRTVLDNMVYTHNIINNVEGNSYKYSVLLDDILSWHNNRLGGVYDYLIFVDEYFKPVNDGVRPLNEDYQKEIYDLMKGCLNTFVHIFNTNLIIVRGSTDERMKTIMEYINV